MSTLAMPSFNPFTFANRLKAAGVPEKQAVAEAELLHDVLAQQTQAVSVLENQVKTLAADTKRDAEQMATKGDIAESRADVKTEIAELRADVKAEIAELRGEVKRDVAELRGEVKRDVAELRGDVKLLYWMMGVVAAGTALIMAGMVSLIIKAYF